MGYLDKAGLSHVWERLRGMLEAKQDKLTGQPGQIVGFDAQGMPAACGAEALAGTKILGMNILETICEDLELTDSSPSLSAEVTLDKDGLYFLNYRTYQSGVLDESQSAAAFSRVTTDGTIYYVRWLSDSENNSVTLTENGVTDTWRAVGSGGWGWGTVSATAVVSIYKVERAVKNELELAGLGLEGCGAVANGIFSHAEGNGSEANGNCAHAEGSGSAAVGNYTHAEGYNTNAGGLYAHAEGCGSTASGKSGHAEGQSTAAQGECSHAEGYNAYATGNYSHAEGYSVKANGNYAHAGGRNTIASGQCQRVVGAFNIASSEDTDKVIVGCGTSNSARANCFRVTHTGVFASGAYEASGADYAEMFEWADGNPEGEDRTGRFVTLRGEKLRLAGPEDGFVLGIVSGAASVIGDVYDDQWRGMYVRDVFGRPVWEDAEDPEEPGRTVRRQKLDPAYDPDRQYVPRSRRTEWDAVGMLGKLVAVDDGTCQADGWCAVGPDGAATHSGERTRFRVMSRVDERHVRVLIL